LRRAATSIVANIAEGAGKGTAASERNFYIARGSVAETVGLLALCYRRGYLDKERNRRLYEQANAVSAMLWGLMKANYNRVAEAWEGYEVSGNYDNEEPDA
jgi:four helix bundle protein